MWTFSSLAAGILMLLLMKDAVSCPDEYIVNLSGLGLTEVPNDIPDTTLHVDLLNNTIRRIRSNAFHRLESCTSLSLDQNNISQIEDGAFNGLVSLEMLNLRKNRLTKITTGMFSSFLPSCLVLVLTENFVSEIEPNAFSGLTNLTSLTFYGNYLTRISPGMFDGLKKLESLTLSKNLINRIEKGSFTDQHNLVNLFLFNNSLIEVHSQHFSDLKSLENLTLGLNQIRSLEYDVFAKLRNMKRLWLYKNALIELRGDMFSGLANLVRLHLHMNNISSIEDNTFSGLGNVEQLWLSHNALDELRSNQFQGLSSLEDLILSRNNISSLDSYTFLGLCSLKYLWLDYNNLYVIHPLMFFGLNDLELLDLTKNNLMQISPGAFGMLHNLRTLDLVGNKLTKLEPGTFQTLQKLSKIWLSVNNLVTLQSNVFAGLPRRLRLAMDGNPLLCDSKLCWIKQGEEEGWLEWILPSEEPKCNDGLDWKYVALDCLTTIGCSDPGSVPNSTRIGSEWPFSLDSRITYTCDTCFTGGGAITCQSNGKWTNKPECIALVCENPLELTDGRPTPSCRGTVPVQHPPHRQYKDHDDKAEVKWMVIVIAVTVTCVLFTAVIIGIFIKRKGDGDHQNSVTVPRHEVNRSEDDLGYVNETIRDSMVASPCISAFTLSLDSGFRESTPQDTGGADSVPHQSSGALYSNQQEDITEYSDVYETDHWRFKMGTQIVGCDTVEDTSGKLQEIELSTLTSSTTLPETGSSDPEEENRKCGHGLDEMAIGYVKVTDYEPDAPVSDSA